jgi:hypothetical protein
MSSTPPLLQLGIQREVVGQPGDAFVGRFEIPGSRYQIGSSKSHGKI